MKVVDLMESGIPSTITTHDEFRKKLLADFSLSYKIEKDKHAHDMVIYSDGTSGHIGGPFAGHSHNCRLAYFTYGGWAYAFINSEWKLLRNGHVDWRQGENPFPSIHEDDNLNTW